MVGIDDVELTANVRLKLTDYRVAVFLKVFLRLHKRAVSVQWRDLFLIANLVRISSY